MLQLICYVNIFYSFQINRRRFITIIKNIFINLKLPYRTNVKF